MEIRNLTTILFWPITGLSSDGPKYFWSFNFSSLRFYRLRHRRRLWLLLCFCLFAASLFPQPIKADQSDLSDQSQQAQSELQAQFELQAQSELEEQLSAIKEDFQEQLVGLSDHLQLSSLSIKAAAEAWMASAFAASRNSDPFDLNSKLRALQDQWDEAEGSWPTREQIVLKFYYEAAGRLMMQLILQESSNAAFQELASLIAASRLRNKANTQTAQLAENKVIWSNRICALLTILIKLKSPEQADQLDDLVEDMLNRAEVVARRTDIHYMAKMELLYLNNSQSLTAMLFLLAKSRNSPIASMAEDMETVWQQYCADAASPVSELMSLTWATNVQITLPIAWWLGAGQ